MSFSFKNFEDVRLKATYEMNIGGRTFVEGETIALFDQIQIAGLDEIIERVSAQGGFDNRSLVFWESAREEQLRFSQGVFNKTEFGLLMNAGMVERAQNAPLLISIREYLETDEHKVCELKYIPTEPIFVYDTNGNKLNYTIDGKELTLSDAFMEIVVDYTYNYLNSAKIYQLSSKFINGFLSLEGMTRVKDDATGKVVTGILKIPHLKLTQNLSIRLGAQANPVVANFEGLGVPVGTRGNTYISEFYLLSDDLKADL